MRSMDRRGGSNQFGDAGMGGPRHTLGRNDGVVQPAVNSLRHFVRGIPADLSDGWQERMRRKLETSSCSDDRLRSSFATGWTIADVVTFASQDGIPEAERDQVIRRFYRLDRSRSTPGDGLGLALVKAIADLHGADLLLSSASSRAWGRSPASRRAHRRLSCTSPDVRPIRIGNPCRLLRRGFWC